ncbi:hypothetical protein BHS09_08980 [Myxococcus xanthus]|uniref:Uncharacterized protein n=1 Tax=Myxococcus xanthus TaxID=34 RepID=A0AAE6FXJ0_MYXXA|nr:hypothetical protein BHS09_08980 [Myxococcus xanthus]QDE74397.1 hypothetical protein BHS08_08990 [Myxococcus xanthus]
MFDTYGVLNFVLKHAKLIIPKGSGKQSFHGDLRAVWQSSRKDLPKASLPQDCLNFNKFPIRPFENRPWSNVHT